MVANQEEDSREESETHHNESANGPRSSSHVNFPLKPEPSPASTVQFC
jgi:hypothetical protein